MFESGNIIRNFLAGQLVDLELGGVEATAALEALADVAADHFAQARQLHSGNTTPPSQHTITLHRNNSVSDVDHSVYESKSVDTEVTIFYQFQTAIEKFARIEVQSTSGMTSRY